MPNRTAYEVLVAEVMLQRTTAASVSHVYPKFIEHFPNWQALSRASEETLQQLLRPLGLWRLKSSVFIKLARLIEERGGVMPTTRQELEQLDGIGQYTASAVLCVVHDQPEPFIDANMSRVLERFFGPRVNVDIRNDPYLHTLSRKVVAHKNSLGLNWAILDFSALVCKPRRPLCQECPVRERCLYFQHHRNT